MKMLLIIIIILFSQNGYTYVGELLYINKLHHKLPKKTKLPSCTILKHRALEFKKFARELRDITKKTELKIIEDHNYDLGYMDSIDQIKQKIFSDPSTNGKRNILSTIDIEISKDFDEVISEVGFDNIILSFDFIGFTISEKVKYLRKYYGFKIKEIKSKGLVRVKLKVSRYYMCQNLEEIPVVSWLPNYTNFKSRIENLSFRRDKLEEFNKKRYVDLYRKRTNASMAIRDFILEQDDEIPNKELMFKLGTMDEKLNSYFSSRLFLYLYKNGNEYFSLDQLIKGEYI